MKQATRCVRARICCDVGWRRTEPRRVPNDLVLRLPRALQPGLLSLHFLRLGCNSESSYTAKRYPISERFPTIMQFPIVRNLQIAMDIDRSKLGRIRCASELRERLEKVGNRQAERGDFRRWLARCLGSPENRLAVAPEIFELTAEPDRYCAGSRSNPAGEPYDIQNQRAFEPESETSIADHLLLSAIPGTNSQVRRELGVDAAERSLSSPISVLPQERVNELESHSQCCSISTNLGVIQK